MSVSAKTRFDILTRDKFTCQYCGRRAPTVPLEVDHVLPVSGEGGGDPANLVTSCFDCNRGKGTRLLDSDLGAVKGTARGTYPLEGKYRKTIPITFDWVGVNALETIAGMSEPHVKVKPTPNDVVNAAVWMMLGDLLKFARRRRWLPVHLPDHDSVVTAV